MGEGLSAAGAAGLESAAKAGKLASASRRVVAVCFMREAANEKPQAMLQLKL
jgi:hypothetical protein